MIRIARVLLIAGGAAVGAVLAEGLASAISGRSIFRAQRTDLSNVRLKMFDAERMAAAAKSAGPYAVDVDPWVSMKMKSGFTARFLDADATTDAQGQRVRVGPAPDAGAPRIVVLGDSVAFGYGLRDGETIAQQLESLLSLTMQAGAPKPVAFTVACPGWTFENEKRYLLDHLDELAPDVVLYVPVMNDLDDSFSVLETGHRATELDPARGAENAHCSVNSQIVLSAARLERFPNADPPDRHFYALYSGVTPESRRRYEAVADGLKEIGERLAARRSHLAVLILNEQTYLRRLMHFLAARAPGVPRLGLFDTTTQDDQLPGDPHPNARFARAIAWRCARLVIGEKWIAGAGDRALQTEDERYAGREMQLAGAAEIDAERARWDGLARQDLGARIDFETATGWHQIYGGVGGDGTVGISAFSTLANAGRTKLRIALDLLKDHASLVPFHVQVRANGQSLGEIDVRDASAPRRSETFALPAALQRAPFLDVELISTHWITEVSNGISRLASFRLVSLSLED